MNDPRSHNVSIHSPGNTEKEHENTRARVGGDHQPSFPVSIDDMTVAYSRKPVLWDVDLDLPEGQLIGVLGPNGAGKSTLIKAALGLIPSVSGRVLIYGKPYPQQRHRVAYVPQRESIDWDFPVSALDVAVMGRYGHVGWCRPVTRKDRTVALHALQRMGMADYADRQISQLSGGQQQRVFLARALAQEADIYFMDEPLAGVDASTEKTIVELLRTLRNEGRTVIVVHHDLHTVKNYFDQVILLNMRVVAAGPTAQTFTPENMERTYGGRLTLLDDAAQAMAQEG